MAKKGKSMKIKAKTIVILIIVFITMLLIFSVGRGLFAQAKTYKVDLDKDGKPEIITSQDMYSAEEQGKVVIEDANNNIVGSFYVLDRLTRLEFVDLNKDGNKEIVAWSSRGALYNRVAIYRYKDGKLYKIFEEGSTVGIEADFDTKPPVIRIGRIRLDKEGRSYKRTPDWEIWVWDGKDFYK